MTVDQKIHNLREAMKSSDIAAIIIPSNDAHQSEYVPDYYKGRTWISGFTGSAGVVVITQDEAGLWTDGRYYLQGAQQLAGSCIKLHKMDGKPGPQYIRWIADNLPKGSRVSIDGDICALTFERAAQQYLDPKGIELDSTHDLLTDIWTDRPTLPMLPVYEHDTKYNGESRDSKMARIWNEVEDKGADYYLVTTLDDIAWTLNLRGSDVQCNPVFLSYLLLHRGGATLYVDQQKVSDGLAQTLLKDRIEIKPYKAIAEDLAQLPIESKLLIDPANCTLTLKNAAKCKTIEGSTIPRRLKAVKNKTELGHVRKAMEKDGAALAHTFYWIEQTLKQGNEIKETEVAHKLAENRKNMGDYVGESFDAIVGYKGNGAIIHYRAMPDTCASIKADGVLLCDSGGQYLDGTTDVTRTLAMGTPTAEEKRCFTLVLKGMIALTEARFPKGTTGGQLDTLARQFLWNAGLNYGHGTGHGVGFFLNVHEPPQGFAPPPSERASTVHEVGMISSNEPGYYQEGDFGIRIENLVVTTEDKIEGFLCHETLTLYPIDIKMIDERLMTSKEKAWLNKYHHEVWERVSPLLEGEIKAWFELKCRGMN